MVSVRHQNLPEPAGGLYLQTQCIPTAVTQIAVHTPVICAFSGLLTQQPHYFVDACTAPVMEEHAYPTRVVQHNLCCCWLQSTMQLSLAECCRALSLRPHQKLLLGLTLVSQQASFKVDWKPSG
jgi:hypothetical protein